MSRIEEIKESMQLGAGQHSNNLFYHKSELDRVNFYFRNFYKPICRQIEKNGFQLSGMYVRTRSANGRTCRVTGRFASGTIHDGFSHAGVRVSFIPELRTYGFAYWRDTHPHLMKHVKIKGTETFVIGNEVSIYGELKKNTYTTIREEILNIEKNFHFDFRRNFEDNAKKTHGLENYLEKNHYEIPILGEKVKVSELSLS